MKENHLGDLFYNTDTGAVFRFAKENGTYKWQQLSDDEVANARALATGVESNVGGDNPVYANIMTRYKSSTEAYIIVRTADDDSENDGAFTFMLYNASTWDD